MADGLTGLTKNRIQPDASIDRVDQQPNPFKDTVPETGEENDRSVRSKDDDLLQAINKLMTKLDVITIHLQTITELDITEEDLQE